MARRLGVLLLVVVGVALLVWAGLYNLRQRRARMQEAQVTLIKAGGEAGSDGASGSAGNAAGGSDGIDDEGADLRGKPAPGFTLVDLEGKKVSLKDFKGHPVVVNFWATWCGPCRLEMPWFEEFSKKYKPQGLVILGLSQDDGTAKDVIAAAAQKIGVDYPVLLPDDTVSKKYGGVDYLPESFYVDKNGTVVEVTAGAPTKDQMEADIKETIAAGGA